MRSWASVLGCHGQRINYSFGPRRLGDDSSALRFRDKVGGHGEIHHPKSQPGKEGAGNGRSGDSIPKPDVDDGDVCFGASDMFPAMPVISNPASIATSSITRAIPGSSSTMSRRMVRLQGGYKIGAALSGVANRKHLPPQAVPRVGLQSQVPPTKDRDPDGSLRSRVRALCVVRTNEVSEAARTLPVFTKERLTYLPSSTKVEGSTSDQSPFAPTEQSWSVGVSKAIFLQMSAAGIYPLRIECTKTAEIKSSPFTCTKVSLW